MWYDPISHATTIVASSPRQYAPYHLDAGVSFHKSCTCQNIKVSYKYFKVMFIKYLSIAKLNT